MVFGSLLLDRIPVEGLKKVIGAILLIFALTPSLIWLFYFLKKDPHPEPKREIVKIFPGVYFLVRAGTQVSH